MNKPRYVHSGILSSNKENNELANHKKKKIHGGSLNAYSWVKKASLKRPHITTCMIPTIWHCRKGKTMKVKTSVVINRSGEGINNTVKSFCISL